jgi:hypothetical protein
MGTRATYDRRVPPLFLDAFRVGNPLHELVTLAQELDDKAVDLQLRAYEDKRRGARATLYVGTSKAIDIEYRPAGQFRFKGQRGKTFEGKLDPKLWRPEWETTWYSNDELCSQWASVSKYVRDVITNIDDRHLREGVWQTLVSRGRDDLAVSVIDREVMLANASAEFAQARAPIQAAVDALKGDERSRPWLRNVNEHRAKLDALAVDARGRVLLIEVKRITETGEAGRTPAQIALYHELFTLWANGNRQKAVRILQGMLDQRNELGIGRAGIVRVATPLQLVPVIAFGGATRPKSLDVVNDRMSSLLKALNHQRVMLDNLEVWRMRNADDLQRVRVGEL